MGEYDALILKNNAQLAEIANQLSTVEVLPINPVSPSVGQMWLYVNTDVLVDEFTGTDNATWDTVKWRDDAKNAAATADTSKTDILSNKGRMSIQSTGGTAYIRKVTQNQVVDYSSAKKTLEFDVEDYKDTSYDNNMRIAVCSAVSAGDSYEEQNWIGIFFGVSAVIPGAHKGLLVQKGVNGSSSVLYAEEITTGANTLHRYRFEFTTANNISIQRWNGSEWVTLYSTATAGLLFSKGYVSISCSTGTTSAPVKTRLIDNIKLK